MSYCNALELAGANVLAFRRFGSYSGPWFALVARDGKYAGITGSYGSCSGCDRIERAMDRIEWADYDDPVRDEKQRAVLREIGESYLTGLWGTRNEACAWLRAALAEDYEAKDEPSEVAKFWAQAAESGEDLAQIERERTATD